MIEVTTSENGLLKYLKPGSIHIATATILPSTTQKLYELHKEHKVYYIAANVLGIPKVALAGKLTTFVAGDQSIIEKIQNILQTFAANIINVGNDPTHANVMKISANYILMTNLELISELYVYAEKNNMDLKILQEFLHNVYALPAAKLYIDKIKDRNFNEVNFDMHGGAKDVNVFQKAFSEAGVVPALAYVANSRFIAALANGMENKDWSAIYEIVRAQAGFK
jgi:3-hydroxyisobutyrate dehydrogenase-like beta-hydroxyacid dehydrogenase